MEWRPNNNTVLRIHPNPCMCIVQANAEGVNTHSQYPAKLTKEREEEPYTTTRNG